MKPSDAKMEMELAKLKIEMAAAKMEMAAAKLHHFSAVAACEAAESGQDTAESAKTKPSFSTRSEKCVKPKGLQVRTRKRPPSYWRRLQRRRKE